MMRGETVELTVSEHADRAEMSAYEELLTDAMRGVSARFARQDYVEEAWRIVDPVLDDATPVYAYEPGTWGPTNAGMRDRASRRLDRIPRVRKIETRHMSVVFIFA